MPENHNPGLLAAAPYDVPRRGDRATCPNCKASPAGCDGNHWLRGRWCCESCQGSHDDTPKETR